MAKQTNVENHSAENADVEPAQQAIVAEPGDGEQQSTPSDNSRTEGNIAGMASHPSEQWESWSHIRQVLGEDSQQEFEGSRTKLKRATAMLAIEIARRSGYDWSAEARDLNKFVPNSRHPCMAQASATFGAPVTDADAQKARAKFLDSSALAVQYLSDAIAGDISKFPADEDGIDAVVELIDNLGGLANIAAAQRKKNNASKATGETTSREAQIELSPQAVRNVQIERARDMVEAKAKSQNARIRLAVVFDDGHGVAIGAELPSDAAAIDEAMLNMRAVDPLTDQLGELMQVGQIVAEEKSSVLVDPLDDPEKPEKGFRDATRHFIFRDGMPVLISPILNSSSCVVLAMPTVLLFNAPLGSTAHLATKERKVMEANIADPERRGAFTSSIGSAEGTQGHLRFVVKTDAAAKPGDHDRNVGVLVEPLKSAAGNLPLEFDRQRFKPKITASMTPLSWRTRHNEYIAKVAKPSGDDSKKQQTHRVSEGTWTISSAKKNDERDVKAQGHDTSVDVLAADFARVSGIVADLPVQGEIQVSVERHQGLLVTFATKWFSYEVYVPALTTAGHRTTALLATFENPVAG